MISDIKGWMGNLSGIKLYKLMLGGEKQWAKNCPITKRKS